MIVVTSNKKLKQKTCIHHLLQLKLLVPLGEFCPQQIILTTVCDQTDDAVNLAQCHTLPLDKRVRKMTQELVDTKLLAKLSEGDMIATEVK